MEQEHPTVLEDERDISKFKKDNPDKELEPKEFCTDVSER